MKKLLFLLLVIVTIFGMLAAMTITVSAADSASQNGIEVSIITDKDTYDSANEVNVTIVVKNTNAYDVNGLQLKVDLPAGLALKTGDLSIPYLNLSAGASYSKKVVAVKAENAPNGNVNAATESEFVPTSPKTGYIFNWLFVLVSVFAIVSTAYLLIKHREKAIKSISLFLCIIMVVSLIPLGVFATEDTINITVEKTIVVAGEQMTIKATLAPQNEKAEYYCTIYFDSLGGTSVNNLSVKLGDFAEMPDLPEKADHQFVGWYIDEQYTTKFDFNDPITKSLVLFARWIDIADTTDTDGDGLTDPIEEYYGTNKTQADTDGDGLSDYVEIFTLGLDPLKIDTDGNGINDGIEDLDADGLTNLQELAIGTDPLDYDTDDDELSDGDEHNNYGTNPLKEDTDEDGVSDGKEIELGTDPLVAQVQFSMSLSAPSDEAGTTASVQMDLSGDQVETLSVEPVNDEVMFPETMPGYMGQAYDFSVEGTFDSAVISFEFDDSNLSPEADPVIYYYNEDTQDLEELETTVVGNTASATVTHFSKYILVDRRVWEECFSWMDVWDSNANYTGVEVVLVIDDSGSMSWNDSSDERLTVARNLIDKLPDNSKVGIVKFETYVEELTTSITEDKTLAKSYLTNEYFESYGGTYMYEGIDAAFSLFESTDNSIMKMMVVLSDGDAFDTHMHSSIITKATENGVRIYTVGLGTSSTYYFNNYLKPLANDTGAAFYLASSASELADIYKDINQKIDIETDSDEDGISDYYEENMICFNGVKIALDKNKKDTDGDGLLDGEEVELDYVYNSDRTRVLVTGKLKLGNPLLADTDNDGYNDKIDLAPFVKYKTPIILLHGRTDNTKDCFGVENGVSKDINSKYNVKESEYDFTKLENQKITKVETNDKLGNTLRKAGYRENSSMFAFNYPNRDMAKANALKLQGYIENLIAEAKNESSIYVTASCIFPTKDKDINLCKFDLIGHSNGGLVSRFYVENLGGSAMIRKLITIDTPHYGSGIAVLSDVIDLADGIGGFFGAGCYPIDVDLNPDSTLFNNRSKKHFISLADSARADYINNNQSPKLNGNIGLPTKYYAVGGYDVESHWYNGDGNGGLIKDEIDYIPSYLRDTQFGFDFTLAKGTKERFNNSIRQGYLTVNNNIYLYLNDDSGDNIVNVRSQFGVKNDFFGNIIDYVNFHKTSMIVDTVKGHGATNHFHSATLRVSYTRNKVVEYLND